MPAQAPRFERWRVDLEPGARRPTHSTEWAGALVLVERGVVRVECLEGGHETFRAGDMVALGWLPLRTLHNPGEVPARLLAIRRRLPSPTDESLRRLRRSRRIEPHRSVRGGGMRYRTTIAGTGTNTTGIPVPDDVLSALGAGKRPPVTVRVGSHSYRTTVGSVDGAPMISLSAENRAAAGVVAGDEVEVEVTLDTAPRIVEVPPDLTAALDADPAARRTFDALSNSNRKWHVLQVEGAKTAETRERRIAKSVAALREGRPR